MLLLVLVLGGALLGAPAAGCEFDPPPAKIVLAVVPAFAPGLVAQADRQAFGRALAQRLAGRVTGYALSLDWTLGPSEIASGLQAGSEHFDLYAVRLSALPRLVYLGVAARLPMLPARPAGARDDTGTRPPPLPKALAPYARVWRASGSAWYVSAKACRAAGVPLPTDLEALSRAVPVVRRAHRARSGADSPSGSASAPPLGLVFDGRPPGLWAVTEEILGAFGGALVRRVTAADRTPDSRESESESGASGAALPESVSPLWQPALGEPAARRAFAWWRRARRTGVIAPDASAFTTPAARGRLLSGRAIVLRDTGDWTVSLRETAPARRGAIVAVPAPGGLLDAVLLAVNPSSRHLEAARLMLDALTATDARAFAAITLRRAGSTAVVREALAQLAPRDRANDAGNGAGRPGGGSAGRPGGGSAGRWPALPAALAELIEAWPPLLARVLDERVPLAGALTAAEAKLRTILARYPPLPEPPGPSSGP